MKILHAISGDAAGGAELAFERAVSALAHQDLDQKAVIRTNSARRQRLSELSVTPIELPFRPRFDFSSKRRLNAEISAFDPDLVVSWTPDVSVQVDSFRGQHAAYIGKDFPATKIQGCDHLFAASQQRVDRVTNAGWPTEKVSLLPHIIPSDGGVTIDRKEFFTPDTAKLVVVVGALYPENSIDILLEAIARISGLYLWIVGEGPLSESLQSKALESGIKPRTRFVGWRYDASALIQAADLIICPAKQDDTGSGVLEAWACGKPVIAADSIGPGLLIRHRENGVLVPVDDVRSLAEAIKWVMQDTSFAERIAAAGREAYEKSHSESIVTAEYLKVFRALVSGSNPNTSENS